MFPGLVTGLVLLTVSELSSWLFFICSDGERILVCVVSVI